MKLRSIALVPVLATMFVALAGCGGGKSSNAANAAASAAAGTTSGMKSGATNAMQNAAGAAAGAMGSAAIPNCGAVQAVWVNLNSKVYHEPGDPAYGKTKHGEYLCPSQAKAQGFRPAGGGRYHRRSSSM
jgi:hypothetical protein